ncbi:MAG: vWA domain-containing protein [Phocaeicola sp.]
MHKSTLLLVLLLLTNGLVYGQSYQNEKRIYLLDVTASMVGKGSVSTPNIFEKVKEKLIETISDIQTSNTEITIIPFTDKAFEPIRAYIDERDSLIKQINSIDIKKGDTNIADAWERAIMELDSSKINYIFLLTDGLHNCGEEKEVLYERLKSWQEIAKGKYFFAFYVMLTPNAKEMEIAQIAESTNQMWIIESMDVNVSFISSTLHLTTNVNENNAINITISSNNEKVFDTDLVFNVLLDENPYYELKDLSIDLKQRNISFKLSELMPRIKIPVEFSCNLHLKYDKTKYPLYFFTPEIISFKIQNKGVRNMIIKEL